LSVSEPQRLALHAAARRALGDEEGDTLMALSPPANTDIATRQDVEHAQALTAAQFAEVRAVTAAHIAELKATTTARIAEARSSTSSEVADVAALVERRASETLRWTVGTMLAGNAAVIAILTLILR
jgi:hypothetical protein